MTFGIKIITEQCEHFYFYIISDKNCPEDDPGTGFKIIGHFYNNFALFD